MCGKEVILWKRSNEGDGEGDGKVYDFLWGEFLVYGIPNE